MSEYACESDHVGDVLSIVRSSPAGIGRDASAHLLAAGVSWAHLDHLLATDDQHAISQEMKAENVERFARIAKLWDELDWLSRVAS